MAASGTVDLEGEHLEVTGIAWFDHQWGDFVSVGGGGWDWFAINLDDGTDLTISVVRDEFGGDVLTYGTAVDAAGIARPIEAGRNLVVDSGSGWNSPNTGRRYPSSWIIFVNGMTLELSPTVLDQELDTRVTTGVIYWEGSHVVTGDRDGAQIRGQAYVEITRYDAPGG